MNYSSIIKIQSTVFPDVVFRIRRISEGMRLDIRLKTSAAFARIRTLEAHLKAFVDELSVKYGVEANQLGLDKLSPAELLELQGFNQDITVERETNINPEFLRACFVGLDGIQLDECPYDTIDAAALIEYAPRELTAEIIDSVLSRAGMSIEAKENLDLPTTSGAVVDGKANGSSAPLAGAPATTSNETAPDTSPAL